jgi:CheY-like chemotaxis protein
VLDSGTMSDSSLGGLSLAGEGEREARTPGALAGHLLVVEDDSDIAWTISEYVDGEGYGVVAAPDGLAALRHLRAGHRPGLILTDFMMPLMSGAELFAQVSHHPWWCDIPVLVVSAVPQAALAAGVPPNVLTTKPLELADLGLLVARHCRRRSVTPDTAVTRPHAHL